MSERMYMTVAGFTTCSQYDFANGAVQSEIYESIKRMEMLETKIIAIVEWLEKNQADVFSRGLWDAIDRAMEK